MNAFSTIQGGINGVDSGGPVEVLPGTYTETVNVDTTGLTLAGYGSAMPTVTAPTTVSYAPIISVAAADVTVSGLNITVNQPYASTGSPRSVQPADPTCSMASRSSTTPLLRWYPPWGHGLANPFGSAYSVGIAALANGGGAIPTVTIQGNQVLAGTGGSLPGGGFGLYAWHLGQRGPRHHRRGHHGPWERRHRLFPGRPCGLRPWQYHHSEQRFQLGRRDGHRPTPTAPIDITDNVFTSVAAPDDALLLIKHDYNATSPVSIQNNTFAVPGSSIGILSADSIGVSVDKNILRPPSARRVLSTSPWTRLSRPVRNRRRITRTRSASPATALTPRRAPKPRPSKSPTTTPARPHPILISDQSLSAAAEPARRTLSASTSSSSSCWPHPRLPCLLG